MLKKNAPVVLIILLALLLIAIVIWWYDKRIENVEKKMKPVSGMTKINVRNKLSSDRHTKNRSIIHVTTDYLCKNLQ